jgi:hypothetical protein
MDSELDRTYDPLENQSNAEFEGFLDEWLSGLGPHTGHCEDCESQLCHCCGRCRSCDGCDADDEYWDARIHNLIGDEDF